MKKWYYLLAFIPLFFLYGCIGDLFTTTTLFPGEMTFDRQVTVVDLATYFDFEDRILSLYQNNLDNAVPYVDIEEFIASMEGMIEPVTITKKSTMKINLRYEVDDSTFYDFFMTIDPHDNTIYFSNILFPMLLGSTGSYESTSTLNITEQSHSALFQSKKMELTPYNLKIVLKDDRYYLPLSLANLLLTGEMADTYLLEDELLVFDELDEALNQIDSSNEILGSEIDESLLIADTTNFMAFLFDYYYGLKSEFNPDGSYLDTFTELGFFESETVEQLNVKIQRFILELDELHTGLMTYGYNSGDVGILSPSRDSRYMDVVNALGDHYPWTFEGDIQMKEYDECYWLGIVEFNDETAELLQTYFTDLDPEKPIYIDLSFCVGGSLNAMLELVTYMTNSSIPLHYTNAFIHDQISESYQAFPRHALSNTFFVFTSKGTYSAASLFTSIVQDMNLGIVFGQPTGGGACAVNYTVLPNQMMLTYSSNYVFSNQTWESIEYGIEPTVTLPEEDSFSEAFTKLNHYYNYGTTHTITDSSTSKDVHVQIQTLSVPDIMTIDSFELKLTDMLTDTVIADVVYDSTDFVFNQNFDDYQPWLHLEVICHYEIDGVSMQGSVIDRMLDSMTDTFTPNTVTVPIDTDFEGGFYGEDDVDYFKLIITEPDAYLITINGSSLTDVHVYTLLEQPIDSGIFVDLQPGTYLVKVGLLYGDEEESYTLRVEQLHDDTLNPTPINISDTEQDVTVSFDYDYDSELITFTLTEESLITILGDQPGYQYDIVTSTGNVLYRGGSNLQSEDTVTGVLPAGSYIIRFDTHPLGDMTFTMKADNLTNDVSGDIKNLTGTKGTLVNGETQILINGPWDIDIYHYEAHEEVYLTIDSGESYQCLIEGTSCFRKTGSVVYHLNPGSYYFAFYEDLDFEGTFLINVTIESARTYQQNGTLVENDSDYLVQLAWNGISPSCEFYSIKHQREKL
ncbi:MAG: S41 family peptidase [Candidatus Izemoplasmatales bacterium]|nr:S41 family peptidase [Candidatus Izemoplasmatales bacterium]